MAAAVVGFLVVSAFVISNTGALSRGKQKRTMADIRAIATAAEAYATDHGAYPVVTPGPVDRIAPLLVPKYLKMLPTLDGWANAIVFSAKPTEYVIVSYGACGEPECDDAWGYSSGKTTSWQSDIVFSNGTFVRWPEGVQN